MFYQGTRTGGRKPCREGSESTLPWRRISCPCAAVLTGLHLGLGCPRPSPVLRGLSSQAGGLGMLSALGALAVWPCCSRGSEEQRAPVCLRKFVRLAHSSHSEMALLCVCPTGVFLSKGDFQYAYAIFEPISRTWNSICQHWAFRPV